MGKEVYCNACGGLIKKKHKAKDGNICQNCYDAAGFPSSISITLIPVALIKEQINNSDGLSIVKRFKKSGGQEPTTKIIVPTSPTVCCPKCGCESISADKKGFGIGKAVVGASVFGAIGLAAGNIGAGKVRITCLKCGHQWMVGK